MPAAHKLTPNRTTLRNSMTVDLVEGELDGVRIERFEIESNDILNQIEGWKTGRSTKPGTYTKLTRNGRLWMSDTDAEKRDHLDVLMEIWRTDAKRVLINGLGLGMIVKGALSLPTVERIDVVEIDARVVELVGRQYAKDDRVRLHLADAYEQAKSWPPGTRWNIGWSDIWPDLTTDNLPDMARLNRSYGRRCDWHRCWGQEQIKTHVRRYGW